MKSLLGVGVEARLCLTDVFHYRRRRNSCSSEPPDYSIDYWESGGELEGVQGKEGAKLSQQSRGVTNVVRDKENFKIGR